MEKPESKKSVPNLEIKISGESERREVMARLLNGYPALFILPKNFDLHLGAGSHGDIRQRSGIQHEDEITEGFIRLKNNVLSVQTRDRTSPEIELAIKEAVNIFLAD